MGVASFEGSDAAFVGLRVRVIGCLRREGPGTAGSFVEVLERVERFVTVVFLAGVDFLLRTSSDNRVGMPAEDSFSGASLVPERVVRGLVVGGAFLAVVAVAIAMVALGAEGGFLRRIGRGIAMVRKLMLDGVQYRNNDLRDRILVVVVMMVGGVECSGEMRSKEERVARKGMAGR